MAVHPTVPDLVMVHVTDPVPAGTAIMPIAATNPFTPARPWAFLWGWGDPPSGTGGVQLRTALTAVVDQDPAANVAARRAQYPDIWSMTGDARMLALNQLCVAGW